MLHVQVWGLSLANCNRLWDLRDRRQVSIHLLDHQETTFCRLWLCSHFIAISALVEQIGMTFHRKAKLNQEDRISRSDTARRRVWEQEKMSQSQTIFLCVCFTCSSKGHASWLWLVVFDPYFFVAERPLPMARTCTVVNFPNFHGQFGSLVFEQTESSD